MRWRGTSRSRLSTNMSFAVGTLLVLPGILMVLMGVLRVGVLVVFGRRRAALGARQLVGGLLLGGAQVMSGYIVIAIAADGYHSLARLLILVAATVVIAGLVVSWPAHWARLGDPSAWRGGKA